MRVGRKRQFDRREALDKAMRLFWTNGYSSTSIATLSSELGINKPSLYSAFGNKEKLFQEALVHYEAEYIKIHTQRLFEPSNLSLHEKIKEYWYGIIDVVTDTETPLGCLLTKSVNELDSVGFPDETTNYLKSMKRDGLVAMIALFTSKISSSNLKNGESIEDLADYFFTVNSGFAVQARIGRSASTLRSVADLSLNVFPKGL